MDIDLLFKPIPPFPFQFFHLVRKYPGSPLSALRGVLNTRFINSDKMYDDTTASPGPNDMSSFRRAIDHPGLMQASSSNNRLGYPNRYMKNPTIQPESHANAQAQLTFDNASPYISHPGSSINSHSNYDTGRVSVQRANNPINAYQSSDTLNHPLAAQSSYSSAQNPICVAGTPNTVCCCWTCRPNAIDDSLFGPGNPISQEHITSSQSYGLGLEPISSAQSFPDSARSFNISQPSSYTPYNQTDSGISQYNAPFHSSMQQHPYGNSSANFGSSSTQFPSNFREIRPPSFDQSFPSTFPDMRLYPPNSSGPEALLAVDQSQFQLSQSSAAPKAFSSQREHEISMTWPEFLKAQHYLDAESKDAATEIPREKLASFLGISTTQLDFCIVVRSNVLPHIEHAVFQSANLGFPVDYAVQWYREIESSSQTSNRGHSDSAYQSGIKIVKDRVQPKKKRKRTMTGFNGPKPYQCTRIKSDGSYCLQENIHLADWKRHEETHWPQKRWECLIHGSNGNVVCHICGGHIDLAGQTTTSHGPCLGRVLRMNHGFHRKDKLMKHAKEAHGCVANVDTWYTDINSDWKRQCGFCGENFTDWDTRCAHVSGHFTTGLRMQPHWKDPWPENDENDDHPPPPDEDDNGDDNEDDDGENHGNDNTYQDHFSDDRSNSRPGYEPSNTRGSEGEGGKRPRRSHWDSNGGNKTHQNDGMEMDHSEETTIDEEQGRQDEFAHPTVQSSEPTSYVAPSKSPPPQTATSSFEFVRKLGYGAFGTVDEVLHSGTKTHFARKSIRTALHHSLPALAQARREVVALCSLRHVHIVGVVAYYTLEDQFSIIMSPVAEGNLSEYLLNDCSTPLTKSTNLSKWMGCLTSAVSYMHEKSWQHLDIKPSNVLVTGGHVMLSDFGGALLTDGSQPKPSMGSSCAVTPMYCAPELVTRSQKPIIAGASDIYSLGCVFLEMATVIHRQSIKSFERLRTIETGDGSYHSNYRKSWTWIHHLWDIDEALGLARQHGLQIISSMLSEDPRKRPTARYIEDSYHCYHLYRSQQEDKHIEEEKYLFITTANTMDRFDPMNVARRWFTNCSRNHKHCSSPARDFFPSRILNVGTDSEFIHLQSSNNSPSPYVALSHCWGAGNILKTTTKTLRAMTQGIKISSLSHAFSDAVRITRALGLKYLWIDSLCILQDRIEDWVSESSQMHKIYSHSSLTICLAGDGNAESGGNRSLTEKPKSEDPNPMCLTCTKGYNQFEQLCDDTPTTMLLDSPWSKRGWTLQERILSPRVLYYSSTRMAWECGGNRSTLDIVSQMRRNLKMLSISKTITASRKRRWDSPFTKPSQELNKLWRDIVKEYSKRQLSVAQDKLPALAGVASEIASLSGQKYLAGLWSNDLIHSLLWCRDFATTPLPPPLEYRAPSWSWAAIDSPITWSKAIIDFPDDEEAKVLSCTVTPESEKSPFGQVLSGGSLKIRGSMQKVLIKRSHSHDILDVETRIPFAFAQWDCQDNQHYGRALLDFDGGADELWCLRILGDSGLLLREDVEGVPDTFRRAGVFRIHDSRNRESGLGGTRQGDVRSIAII
ncbi:hypothetical protein BKA65DRAFT_134867 [Rhexocercosporidium sp. MPI-PUGE-AT-0058]|nr:hypothetical protein BKA65DRAFT_134867 [Rhexocercosporidium sp. MPI-PUGE-AT-0058]